MAMRVTEAQTMDVLEMVLAAKVNKEYRHLNHQHGGAAIA